MDWKRFFLTNPDTIANHAIYSFLFGFIFSPFNKIFLFFILSVLVYELFIYGVHCKYKCVYYPSCRIVINLLYFGGFFLGKAMLYTIGYKDKFI